MSPPDLAGAVDAALGPWAGAVAFDDDENLAEAVGRLKASGRGGVPIVGQSHAPGVAALGRWPLPPGWRPSSTDSVQGPTALWPRALLGRRRDRRGLGGGMGRGPSSSSGSGRDARRRSHLDRRDQGVAVPTGPPRRWSRQQSIDLDRVERELARVVSRFTTLRDGNSTRADRPSAAALEALESIEAKLAGATEALGRSTQDGCRPRSRTGPSRRATHWRSPLQSPTARARSAD